MPTKNAGQRSQALLILIGAHVGMIMVGCGGEEDFTGPIGGGVSGDRIVYDCHGNLFITPLAGGAATVILEDSFQNFEPNVSPDGSRILYSSNRGDGFWDMWVMPIDGTTQQHMHEGQHGVWSPNGERIAFVKSGSLWLMNSDGSTPQQVLPGGGTRGFSWPTWSPDGTQIALAKGDTDAGFADTDIVVYTLNSRSLIKLTDTDGLDEVEPAWSSDAMIAFRRVGLGLWMMNADGSGQRQIVASEVEARQPAWSPDGSALAFVLGSPGDLFVGDFDSPDEPIDLGQSCASRPSWVP